jgi:hypothetical protein
VLRFPREVEIAVIETTPETLPIVIPPLKRDLSDEDLAKISGGLANSTSGNRGCRIARRDCDLSCRPTEPDVVT